MKFFQKSFRESSDRRSSVAERSPRLLLRLETLEDRALLSVSPSDFASLQQTYDNLDFSDYRSVNFLEIQPSAIDLDAFRSALAQAATSPEDDVIVVHTTDLDYRLELGGASLTIDVDSERSGSVTIVAEGARPLQIFTTSAEGPIVVQAGELQLGGAILFSSDPSWNIQEASSAATVDSVVFLSPSNGGSGMYALDNLAEDGLELGGDRISGGFNPCGNPSETESNGFASDPAASAIETWTVDFQYSETDRVFLTGLTLDETASIVNNTIVWTDAEFYDADKLATQNDGDDSMCWAAAASNMLTYAGWSAGAGFADEEETFDAFKESYIDYGGQAYYGCAWFLEGNYSDRFSTLSDAYSGGYFADQLIERGESAYDYLEWTSFNLASSTSGMTEMTSRLRSGYAISLNVDWVDSSQNYFGSHCVACWGYTYNSALSPTDTGYYTSLFITDSDDYQTSDRQLCNYAIEWRVGAERYSGLTYDGYVFSSYGHVGNYWGFLSDYISLAPKPNSFVVNTPQNVRPVVPEGWSSAISVVASSNSVTPVSTIASGSDAYLKFAFTAAKNASGTVDCDVYVDDVLFDTIVFSDVEEQAIESYTLDLGVYSAGSHTVKVVLDAGGDVNEYCESDNILYSAFNVGSLADPFESNGTSRTATALGTVDAPVSVAAASVTGDKDFYSVTLAEPCSAGSYVEVDFSTVGASPDFYVVFYSRLLRILGSSASTDGVAKFSLYGLPAGSYYVCVTNRSNLSAPYTLTVAPQIDVTPTNQYEYFGDPDDPDAPGAPEIPTEVERVVLSTSIPYVGQEISANAYPSAATVAYQWYRSDAYGANLVEIVGATSVSYEPTADDVGYYLTVVAEGVGDYSESASATTAAAVAVPLGALSFDENATFEVAEPVTCFVDNPNATAEYQWYRVDSDGVQSEIAGATAATYTPVLADVDYYLKVVATGVGGCSGSASLCSTTPVAYDFSISFSTESPVYNELIEATVESALTPSVSWYCINPTTGGITQAIGGARTTTYTPNNLDVGYYLRAIATVSDASGTLSISATTANVVTRALPGISFSTAREVGKTLSATLNIATATATYQWYSGSDAEGWTAIEGATSSSYVLQMSDAGKYVKLVATGYGGYTGESSCITSKVITCKLTTVSLSSVTEVGTAITATPDQPGATVTYQWYYGNSSTSAGMKIRGATSATYTPTSTYLGKWLKVTITGVGAYSGTASKITQTAVAAQPTSGSSQWGYGWSNFFNDYSNDPLSFSWRQF